MANAESNRGPKKAAVKSKDVPVITSGPGGAAKVESGKKVLKTSAASELNGNKKANPAVTTSGPGGAKQKASVKFAPNTKSHSRQPEGLTLQNLVPRKVSLGKVNTKRQIAVFVGILAFMLFAALSGNQIGRPSDKPIILSTKEIRKRVAILSEEFKRVEEGRRRKTECGLFLGDSSIPDAGLSWFAGRTYDTNDDVLEPGPLLAGFETVSLSHQVLFLKHHPVLVNICPGDSPDAPFKATRPIQQGEELFLSFENHPHFELGVDHPLFHNIPTLQDYEDADKIFIDEAGSQLARFQDNTLERKIPKRGKMNRSAGGDKALQMLARAVSIFNRRVANLLPKSNDRLGKLFNVQSDFVYNILNNRTVYWLETNGRCMDDVAAKDGTLFAQRPIEKGRVIMIAQYYIRPRSPECEGDAKSCAAPAPGGGTCFGNSESTVHVCPIALATSLQFASTETNAKYAWGLWNKYGSLARNTRPAKLFAELSASVTLEIVATKDISPGDEIVVDMSKDKVSDFGIEVNDEDFPSNWKQHAEAGMEEE